MGNGAERDVLIKLKLVADSNNQAKAKIVAGQAKSVVTAGNASYKKLEKIANDNSKKLTRIGKTQAELIVQIAKLSTAEQLEAHKKLTERIIDLLEKQTASQETEGEKRVRLADKANKKAEKAAKKHAEKLKAAQEAVVAGHQKANESAVVVVQGLADLVEGAANLGLVSEENFEKFTKNFNMVQDGIKVFKGFTDVIWKSREGLVALGTATKAQAAANEILAASNNKVAASSAVAGASGTATAGSGAVATGAKAAGTGIAMIAGVKVLAALTLAAAELASIALVLAEGFLAIARGIEWLIGASWDWNESILVAGDSYLRAAEQAEEAQKKTEAAEKRKQKLLEARSKFEDDEAKRAGFSRDMIHANVAVDDARQGGVSDIDKERIAALRDVQRAEKAVAEEKKIQEERIAAGHFASLKNRVRVTADLEKAQGRMLVAEQNRLKSIMDQKNLIAEQINAEKEKIQIGKDAMKSEQQRIRERFGRLSAADQERAKEIGKKKAGGQELSRRDIQELERLGLAGDHASNFFANAGRQAGADSVAADLTLVKKNEEQADSETNLKKLEREELARSAKEDQQRAAVISRAETKAQTTQNRVSLSAEEQGLHHEDLPGFRKPAAMGKAVQQAAADGSDAVEKASMEVVGALGDTFGSMRKGLEDMKKEVEKNKLLEKAYKS
ncbi:MAG: hypothetical protein K0U86_11740 [Planctomycetes bacterium]|nr:hypothetical protein [Planctomycetota bacterium]MCH9725555.1 hypothetical protein [Planctomycetota bacterium]MCH9777609.1 hypothetical protein [Planctomycetota bacterium]MCH9790804.1 hypothetical protein [Planctomycetota bacterium]